MADPIARGINTFAALKGMEYQGQQARRLERLDEERAADRTFTRDLALKADTRAQEQFEVSKADHEVNKARTLEEWERKKKTWGEEDLAEVRKKADQTYLEFTNEMKALGKTDWGPAEVAELLRRQEPNIKGLRHEKLRDLYDPEKVAERKQATMEILQQLKSGNFEPDSILRNANMAFAPELAARGQKYGAKEVRFSRLVPSPQGDGFMAELEITKADGTTYRAPATMNGGTLDDGDNQVKNFKMEEVVPYLAGQLVTFEGAQSYLKTRGLLKKEERKVKEGGSDKAGRYLYDESTGEKVRDLHGPIGGMAAGGGSGVGGGGGRGGGRGGSGGGGGEIKSHVYDEFNQALLQVMVSKYGIQAGGFSTDEMGTQKVDPIRYLNSLPEEAKQQYLRAQSVGEGLMVKGLSPLQAAQQALLPQSGTPLLPSHQSSPSLDPKKVQQGDIDQVPPERLSLLQQGLKNAEAAGKEEALGFLDQLRKEQPAEFAALTRTLAPSGKIVVDNPQQQGMAPLRDQVFTKLNKGVQQSGWNPDYPAELVGKGLSALWQVAPARLAAVGVADVLKDFQQWSRSRYKTPGAERSAQALAEYAKENPQAAEQIARAAAQAAQ